MNNPFFYFGNARNGIQKPHEPDIRPPTQPEIPGKPEISPDIPMEPQVPPTPDPSRPELPPKSPPEPQPTPTPEPREIKEVERVAKNETPSGVILPMFAVET